MSTVYSSAAVAADSSNGSSSGSNGRRRPARQQSAYLTFCSQQRSQLLAENPSLRPAEVMSRLGAAWRELSDERRAAYSGSSSREQQEEEQPQQLVARADSCAP
jgi:hypothetical protein